MATKRNKNKSVNRRSLRMPKVFAAAGLILLVVIVVFMNRDDKNSKPSDVSSAAPPEKPAVAKVVKDPSKSAVTNSLGMVFEYIPPGTFMMGSPDGESGRDKDETFHQVTLTSGFYMQTTEVTQKQWTSVMGKNPSHFKGCGNDCPVESVTWDDAQEYILKLNQTEGKNYRLPTEAEWEYACRAGTQTEYYTGNKEKNLGRAGWYYKNSGRTMHPVGGKEPNAFGLYDMHGSVREWCRDRYGKLSSGSKAVTDPAGPGKGLFRNFRGGSWTSRAKECRSAFRQGESPGISYNTLGLRLCFSEPAPVRASLPGKNGDEK